MNCLEYIYRTLRYEFGGRQDRMPLPTTRRGMHTRKRRQLGRRMQAHCTLVESGARPPSRARRRGGVRG